MRKFLSVLLVFVSQLSHGQAKQGQAKIDSLLRKLPTYAEDTDKVKILSKLSFLYYAISPDTGIKYGEEAVTIAQKLNWHKGLALAYNALGVNYQYSSNYPKALYYLEKSLRIYEQEGNTKNTAHNLGNIGIVYQAQGNYPKALEYFFKSLKINEQFENKHEIGNNMGNIGSIYLSQGDHEKGLDYYQKSLKIFEELNDKSGIATKKGVIGAIYLEQHNYPNALKYFFNVLKMQEELGDKNGMAYNLTSIGDTYRQQQDIRNALVYYSKALDLYKILDDKSGVAATLNAIGKCYFDPTVTAQGIAKPNVVKAIASFDQALQIANNIGSIEQEEEILKNLSDAQFACGDHKEALLNYRKHIALRDSIFSQQNKLLLANIETQRALDMQDRQMEIEVLKAVNKRNERLIYISGIALLLLAFGIVLKYFISQRRNHLHRLKAKATALQEIAHIQSHDIRGPLATILGLLQEYNHEDPADPFNKEVVEGLNITAQKLDVVVRKVVGKTALDESLS